MNPDPSSDDLEDVRTDKRPDPSREDLDYERTLKGLRPGLKLFGRYVLQRQLGQGGMGVVWLASDGRLGLEVALKFLPDAVTCDVAALDELKRETLRCMKLSHDRVVKVYDLAVMEDGGSTMAAIAMEYVDGKNLSERRLEKASRVFETAEIAPWIAQLCEALEYAHTRAKIVHRDLKPANVMITMEGEVKVMDFGIAASLGDSITRLTRPGSGIAATGGTLPYMSPQQLLGEAPSVGDDVYALGATIYELLTGKPPFFRGDLLRQIETLAPTTMAARREELEVKSASLIPPDWEDTVAACLAKEAKDRPASVGEVWARLHSEPAARAMPTGAPAKAKFTPAAKEERKVAPKLSPPLPSPTGLWIDRRKQVIGTGLLVLAAIGVGAWGVSKWGSDLASAEGDPGPNAEGAPPPVAKLPGGADSGSVGPTAQIAKVPALNMGSIGESREFDRGSGQKVKASEMSDRFRIEGTVLQINDNWGFVVVDKGSDQGVVVDSELLVTRKGKSLCKLIATTVEPQHTVADLVEGTLPSGLKVEIGDTVTISVASTFREKIASIPVVGIGSGSNGRIAVFATKDEPFENSLGMRFVPVAIGNGPSVGQTVLFSIWETRVQDFAAYAAENPEVSGNWKNLEFGGTKQGLDHPVLNVGWPTAMDFCEWLTQRERRAGRIGEADGYRLPTDVEWSWAVGIGDRENPNSDPEEKNGKIENVYPWGTGWPPPAGAGNFGGEEAAENLITFWGPLTQPIRGYRDDFPFTSPVGHFGANLFGLNDLDGNALEWCLKAWDGTGIGAVIRGGGWTSHSLDLLTSSTRWEINLPGGRTHVPEELVGFRCVLSVGTFSSQAKRETY